MTNVESEGPKASALRTESRAGRTELAKDFRLFMEELSYGT